MTLIIVNVRHVCGLTLIRIKKIFK